MLWKKMMNLRSDIHVNLEFQKYQENVKRCSQERTEKVIIPIEYVDFSGGLQDRLKNFEAGKEQFQRTDNFYKPNKSNEIHIQAI